MAIGYDKRLWMLAGTKATAERIFFKCQAALYFSFVLFPGPVRLGTTFLLERICYFLLAFEATARVSLEIPIQYPDRCYFCLLYLFAQNTLAVFFFDGECDCMPHLSVRVS